MMISALAAIIFSAILIIGLCRGDPKRRRFVNLDGAGQSAHLRRLLAAAACVPGLCLAAAGDAAAFMMWLGGSAAIGWFVALSFSLPQKETD